jgi:hypothetical protein
VLDTESTVRTFWIPVLPKGKDRNDTGSFIVKSFQRHYTRSCVVSFMLEIPNVFENRVPRNRIAILVLSMNQEEESSAS